MDSRNFLDLYPERTEKERPTPICPECGSECEIYYQDLSNNIVGCENCLTALDADIFNEEAEEDAKYN